MSIADTVDSDELRRNYVAWLRSDRDALRLARKDLRDKLDLALSQNDQQQILINALNQQSDARSRRIVYLEGQLEGIRPFLDTADECSVDHARSLLEAFNAEVHQLAASMVDYLPQDAGVLRCKTNDRQLACREFIRLNYGEGIASLLHGREVYVLQALLQHILAQEFSVHINAIAPHDARLNESMISVEKTLLVTEHPAVARRWRSLTSTSLGKVFPAPNGLHELLLGILGAHWAGDLVTQEVEETLEDMARALKRGLSETTKRAMRLRRAIMEDITSEDLRTVVVNHSAAFDKSSMIKDFERPTGDARSALKGLDSVVCTTALGLRLETIDTKAGTPGTKWVAEAHVLALSTTAAFG